MSAFETIFRHGYGLFLTKENGKDVDILNSGFMTGSAEESSGIKKEKAMLIWLILGAVSLCFARGIFLCLTAELPDMIDSD